MHTSVLNGDPTAATDARRSFTTSVLSFDEFMALRGQWDHLNERSVFPSLFARHDWITTSLEMLSPLRDDLIPVVCRSGSVLVSSALFVRDDTHAHTLRFAGWRNFDFRGITLAPGWEHTIPSIIEAAMAETGPLDRVVFDGVLPSLAGTIAACLPRARLTQTSTHAATRLDSTSWNEFAETRLSREVRRDVKRKRRRLRELGSISTERALSGPGVAATLFDLHLRRWASVGVPSMFRHAYVRDYFSHLIDMAAADGSLASYVLKLNDRPIAVRLGFEWGGRFWDAVTAYDPQYHAFSPGLVLLADVHAALISKRVGWFDFLGGDHPYKKHWATHEEPVYQIRSIVARSWLARARAKWANAADYGRGRLVQNSVLRQLRSRQNLKSIISNDKT
jgi:CelD/BcsL family acetyltransferase involved in cellulose biosynthesis